MLLGAIDIGSNAIRLQIVRVMGSKELPVTPVPDQVPPPGLPPDKVNAGSLEQTALNGARLTEGGECTVIGAEVKSLHPAESE